MVTAIRTIVSFNKKMLSETVKMLMEIKIISMLLISIPKLAA
jgi:hypothetical protein